MASQLVVIERKTGSKGHAVIKEDGRYYVSCEGHAHTEEYSATTFKKYFKITGEVVGEAKKATKTPKEIQVKLATFTGMFIGAGTYTAKLVNGKYEVETHKKGIQKFTKEGTQIGAKNPKFSNKIVFAW